MADNSILVRLDGLRLKYEEIGQKLTDPEVIADVKQFVQLTKEYKELEPIIETSERFRTALANLAEAKDVLANEKDEEFREIAREEIASLEPAIEKMEEEIKLLLIPKDPQDDKNAIVEIRGGTGGDEAAIFAGDLLRMYTKYTQKDLDNIAKTVLDALNGIAYDDDKQIIFLCVNKRYGLTPGVTAVLSEIGG